LRVKKQGNRGIKNARESGCARKVAAGGCFAWFSAKPQKEEQYFIGIQNTDNYLNTVF